MTVGFDVYGHFSMPLGLKVSADMTLEMLAARGAPVRVHDVGPNNEILGVTGDGNSAASNWVNIFHVNPLTIVHMMTFAAFSDVDFRGHLNVCVPFWELPHVPAAWLPVLRGMDLVLAPTKFIAEAIWASDSSIAVKHFPQTVAVPDCIPVGREQLGLPEGVTLFGTSFAAQAVLERKNPWASIRAFQIAFPDVPAVRLVIRAYDAGNADPSSILRTLRAAAADDPRILILGERLAYGDVQALYAAYDVFVSLHRSEGLGLGPMESMMMGTPVIATGWSGVLDFMTEANSCLVDYRLVPVDVDSANPYGSSSVQGVEQWAEPDVDDAARLMRKLFDEPGLRNALGSRARKDMRERHEEIMQAPFVDDLASLASRLGEPAYGHDARAKALARMLHHETVNRRIRSAKRGIVRALRAAGLKPPAPSDE